MMDFIYDQEGVHIASIKEGEVLDTASTKVGTFRHGNVYDLNGKFIFHLTPVEGADRASSMTAEAVHKLFHPKPLD